MKKLMLALTSGLTLACSPALAADLRPITRAPVVAPVPYYNWSGFYIGGHVGGGWGDEVSTVGAIAPLILLPGTAITTSESGFLAGAQAGINFQMGGFVLGIEGDWSWSDVGGVANTAALIPGVTVRSTGDVDWFATATGRIGYAFNNVLLYAKGGGAWMDVRYTASALLGGVVVLGPAVVDDTRTGWTVGGGVEYAITPNWSAKIEYGYLDFGSRTYTFTTPGAVATAAIDSQYHLVKGGINYRFNWGGPVVASY
jgi:outer membrane immunogenic protein